MKGLHFYPLFLPLLTVKKKKKKEKKHHTLFLCVCAPFDPNVKLLISDKHYTKKCHRLHMCKWNKQGEILAFPPTQKFIFTHTHPTCLKLTVPLQNRAKQKSTAQQSSPKLPRGFKCLDWTRLRLIFSCFPGSEKYSVSKTHLKI